MRTGLKNTKRKSPKRAAEPEPAWEIARLFPAQGCWSEEDYVALDTNRLVEFSDGFVEVLPMPTMVHEPQGNTSRVEAARRFHGRCE